MQVAASGATQTAALFFGGGYTSAYRCCKTEVWNGSSWTEVSDLNTARGYLGGLGNFYICFSFWWNYDLQ